MEMTKYLDREKYIYWYIKVESFNGYLLVIVRLLNLITGIQLNCWYICKTTIHSVYIFTDLNKTWKNV